jgi:hypothetical protein
MEWLLGTCFICDCTNGFLNLVNQWDLNLRALAALSKITDKYNILHFHRSARKKYSTFKTNYAKLTCKNEK